MVKKTLLVFVLLSALLFSQTSNAHAFEFDFFGLRGAVEELLNGPKQEVEEAKPPSIFERFFGFLKGIIQAGNILPRKVTPTPSPIPNPFPTKPLPSKEPELPKERSTLPQDEGGPVAKGSISGKWLGRYTVNTPLACKGESGAWSANLTQTGNRLAGTFQSDAGDGNISGTVSGQNLSWSVGGGGSGISFNGGSPSPNTISGNYTGPVCDPEEAPQKTQGTFFGGRL